MLQLHLAAFLLLAAVPTNSGVEGSGASGPARFVREVEGVSEYELACGVRLLVVPDLSSSTFSLVTTVLSGAADDPMDARGVGHLIEHVLAAQTLNHPHLKDEIASRGDDYGAAIGFEWTRYTVHLPYKADNLSWALDVAADRIENPLYTTESVQHQVPVIRQEEDLHRNDPRESLLRMAWQTTNLSHPYHQAGTDPDLGRLTPEVMLAYHRLHYRPDNVIIVAIGPFSPLEAASAATRSFSKVRRPESSAYVRSTTPEPLQEGLRKFDLERAGRSNAAMLVWRTPPASDPDYAPLLVLQQLLDGASGHSLAANHALSKYEARVVSDLEVEGQSGFLSVYAEAARSVPATTIELAIKDGIASLLAGLSEDNVDAAKRTRAQAWRRKSFDSMEFAETLGTSASAGDWRLAFLVRDRVNAVLRQDVLRVARTYLKPANCTAGLLRAVDQPDLVRLGHGDAAALRDYGTQGPVDEGEAFDWSPPRLEERVLRGVLKGGLKFAILPVRMRGQHAVVSVTMCACRTPTTCAEA